MISSAVTTVVALWGALLSTFVVLRDLWRGRRRARVSVEYGALALPAGQQPFVLKATIANHGREPIHLARAAVRAGPLTISYPTFASAPPLPLELRPGQSFTGDFHADQVWALSSYGRFRKVRVVFFDQLAREFPSDPTPVGEPRPSDTGWSLDTLEERAPSKRIRARFRKLLKRGSRYSKAGA